MTANKIKSFLTFAVFTVIVLSLSLMFVVGKDEEMSISERRPLKQYKEVLESDDPFGEFENYFLDQFPKRDSFRRIKSYVFIDLLKKNENNGFYKYDGSIVSMEKELDDKKVNYTVKIMNSVIDKYFKDYDVYYSIIPDKHFIASKENGYESMDYDKMFGILDL